MTKTILVSAFSNINTGTNSRTLAIYNNIKGEKIVLTTDFNHGKKQYYSRGEMSQSGQVCFHVPAYRKNLSIRRIWSHIVFAKQVNKYLKSLSVKPHAIYCAMPTSTAAYVCAKYCKKHGVNFVIDVIDLWPDSLLPLVKGKAIIKACLFPWTYLTRYAYKSADVILGESDFTDLLNAVKAIHGRYKYKLWFIGDGVRRQEIEKYIDENNLNAEITGFLPHEILLGYLSYCDIAVNIFMKNTKVVYSYKFNDYVAMDCFILNSLEGETAVMIDDYKIGRNFSFKKNNLSEVLSDTLANWNYFSSWKGNAKRLISEKLDKEKIYLEVRDIFEV